MICTQANCAQILAPFPTVCSVRMISLNRFGHFPLFCCPMPGLLVELVWDKSYKQKKATKYSFNPDLSDEKHIFA